jgi:hypothetical protein
LLPALNGMKCVGSRKYTGRITQNSAIRVSPTVRSNPAVGRLQRIREQARIDERIDRAGGQSDSKEQWPHPNAPTSLIFLQRTEDRSKDHDHVDEIREKLAASYKIPHDAGTQQDEYINVPNLYPTPADEAIDLVEKNGKPEKILQANLAAQIKPRCEEKGSWHRNDRVMQKRQLPIGKMS